MALGTHQIHKLAKLSVTGFILGSILLAQTGTDAFAATAGGVGLRPADTNPEYHHQGNWFIYDIDPETTKTVEDTLLVLNTSQDVLTIKIDAVDAILTESGGFGLLDVTSDNKSLGSWIELEEHQVTVAPGERRVVNFKINIPENAEVGDHIGGFVAQKVAAAPDVTYKSGGATVNVITRVGARIYLTIKGDIQRGFDVRKHYFKGKGNKIVFGFITGNTGNIRNNLTFDAKIYGIFGLYDEQKDIAIAEIFPGKLIKKEIVWPGKQRPLFGPYLAIMTVKDTYEPMSHTSTIPPAPAPVTLWAFTFFIPYTQTLVVLILLFLIWFIRQALVWRRMATLARQPVVAYKVKKGDYLVDIADDYGVSWKLLARLNELKPPYSLRRVTTLYIPDARGIRRAIPVIGFWMHMVKPLTRLAGLFKRRVHKLKEGERTIVIEQGDKIRDVENFTGMSWEEILVYNRLRPSFRLRAGRELIVPQIKKPVKKKPRRRKK